MDNWENLNDKAVKPVFVKISHDRDKFGYFEKESTARLKNGLTPAQNAAMDMIEKSIKIISGASGFAVFDPLRIRGTGLQELKSYEIILKATYEKWASMMYEISPLSFSIIRRLATTEATLKDIMASERLTPGTAKKLITMGLDEFIEIWTAEKKGEIKRVPLTPKQLEVYQYVVDHQKSKGYSPTYEEIGEHLHMSKGQISQFVNTIIQRGHGMKVAGQARTLYFF